MHHSSRAPWMILACLAIGLWAAMAWAKAGVQITPDGKRTLISKDVGAERWAITLNAGDGSVTGNIFRSDGGPPQFVSCEETARSGSDVTFHCMGADRCLLSPCRPDEWSFIADASLDETFFLPPLDFKIALAEGLVAGRVAADEVSQSPSGVQVAPGAEQTLISKDVGAERWAITLNEDDGTVTGNVFFPDGGDPAFVWCEKKGEHDGQRDFSCYGSQRCIVAPCPREDWSLIADVALPVTFFGAPTQVYLDDVYAALVAALGDDDAFVAIVVALDKGYSVRQISRAALAGRLRASGDVTDASGDVEPPDGPPLGLFPETASSADLGSVRATLPTPTDLRDQFGNALGEGAKSKVLVRLLDRGFKLSQVGQIARGELQVVDCNQVADPQAFRECVEKYGSALAVVHPDGSIVGPEDAPEDLLTPQGKDPCGNGRIDGGEECDGADLGGQTCLTLRFVGGDLRCNELCEFDVRGCREEPKCGDGYADEGELCDGSDLRGLGCEDVDPRFVGGRLLCTSSCVFDVGQCLVNASCGNGKIDKAGGQPLEDCDGPDLGGKRCSDFPPYVAGLLRCTANCVFDTSECRDAGNTDCGNGIAEGNEQCDRRDLRGQTCITAGEALRVGPFVGGELGCDTDCHYVFDSCTTDATCGNGVAEGYEDCDGSDLRGQTCQSVGQTNPDGPFSGGTLRCENCHFVVSDCIRSDQCGDGVRDRPYEECDKLDFGGDTCESLFNKGGNLICTPACTLDPLSCEREQRCGDDFAEGNEQCDGSDLRGQTCETVGFAGGGTLACGPDCQFDTSKCIAVKCGDGFVDGDEECDGQNLQGATCTNLGFLGGGTLSCGSDCKFDTRQCLDGPKCGDGVAEGNEACDGEDLRHQTCTDFGFDGGGTLRCYSSCQYDTSGCLEEPRCTEQLCPDGTCVPVGADCCGGGAWCDPGYACVDGGGCCPSTSPLACAGLYCMPQGADCCGPQGWCNPGWVCAGDGCCPAATPKACGDGTCTTPDRVCCGNGLTCPGGTQCLPDGKCG